MLYPLGTDAVADHGFQPNFKVVRQKETKKQRNQRDLNYIKKATNII